MSEAKGLEYWRELGQRLYDGLRLQTYPLAVRFMRDRAEFPKDALRPKALGRQMTLCQGFTMVRRNGVHMAMTLEDNQCITSSLVHGWADLPPADILQSQAETKYHADIQAEIKINSVRKRMPVGEFCGMVVSPLPNAVVEPMVALIYGNPAQITHLVHSLSYHGRVIQSAFFGYGESCIKGLIDPYLTGEPQVVLPGTGDRAAALTTDDEMAIGIPAALIEEAAENLFKSAGGLGVKQPINWLSAEIPAALEPKAWPFNRERLAQKK